MGKLQIYVCENFYSEYKNSLVLEGIEDIELRFFPSLCENKARKNSVKEIFERQNQYDSTIVCSKSCDVLRLLPEGHSLRTLTKNYCFSHLTCEEFLNYLTSQGSYIISSDWLKKWEKHIKEMGFDKDTAKLFFQETSKQLVFLDAMKEKDDELHIVELSSYIGLPYIIVPVELEGLRLMLKSMVYEWRLHVQEKENKMAINELRKQCAEYSTVFDMLGKISTYAKKRDVIGQIKELFIMVFGAKHFSFWVDQTGSIPEDIRKLQTSEENYLLLREDNRFCIKITWNGKLYGIIDVSGFIFPQYIEKYLNLAVEVAQISGLVFHNNEQYEKILESEKELKYLSFHDSMTGLYNRAYINKILSDRIKDNEICVFMFDIDKLKYVNDNFGHAEGDKLIVSFAKILKKSFRENDIVARIGGDEFVAILYNTDERSAKDIRQRIIELIRIDNQNKGDNELELSVSIGYAKSKDGEQKIEELMNQADIQMYNDKSLKCKNV